MFRCLLIKSAYFFFLLKSKPPASQVSFSEKRAIFYMSSADHFSDVAISINF